MFLVSLRWRQKVFRGVFLWPAVGKSDSFFWGCAIMQLFLCGAKCAHFLNFIPRCGVFAYKGFFRKMFLTFPFGYRIL